MRQIVQRNIFEGFTVTAAFDENNMTEYAVNLYLCRAGFSDFSDFFCLTCNHSEQWVRIRVLYTQYCSEIWSLLQSIKSDKKCQFFDREILSLQNRILNPQATNAFLGIAYYPNSVHCNIFVLFKLEISFRCFLEVIAVLTLQYTLTEHCFCN